MIHTLLFLIVFVTEPVGDWTALFDRTDGWLGADGIYSIPLDGNDNWGSAGKESKTLFVFSDTMLGTADTKTHEYRDAKMVNHSAAILTGNEPLPQKINFLYGKDGDGSQSNLFGKNYWLQDGIVINQTLYLTGFCPDKSWKPEQIDLFSIPLSKEKLPVWTQGKRTERFPLLAKNGQFLVCFGIGILDQTESNGFIYVYGYRDNLKTNEKHLVAARVEQKSFSDAEHWQFWNGKSWTKELKAAFQNEAVLAERISTELSVTPIEQHRFLLVFVQDVMSGKLAYKVGSSPIGPFGETVIFYEAPEPKELGEGIYVYNAKAHPHLSKPGRLLISYNVNRFAGLPHKTDEYRPRFVELPADVLPKN